MTAIKSVPMPGGIECIGGPLDGQRLEFCAPQVCVPLAHTQENLRRWNLNDRTLANPINCCAGWYDLTDGEYRWDC